MLHLGRTSQKILKEHNKKTETTENKKINFQSDLTHIATYSES